MYDMNDAELPRGDGAVAYSNPAKGTFAASVARTF